MLSFSTEFPVSKKNGSKEFLDAIRYWILGSPHTQLNVEDLKDIPQAGSWSVQKKHEAVATSLWSSPNELMAGAKWILTADRLEWETSVVYSRRENDAWVGIRTSRESSHPAVRLPPAKKPIVVRTVLASLNGALDGELQVSQKPLYFGNDDIALAGRLITGEAGCRLPVVYISCGFNQEHVVAPQQIANDLSGMAHVVVEPNRPFSRRLQIEVKSENVYGGTIGIYWPDGAGRRAFFLGHELDSSEEIRRAIGEDIRVALMNRRPLVRCTWSAIQEAVSRDALHSLKASGSQEIEKYIANFDAELKAKNEQLQDAETEIARLSNEVRRHEAQTSIGSDVTIQMGDERDLYGGETTDIVRDALEDALNRVQSDSRREHVLRAILAKMPATGVAKQNREDLKELLPQLSNYGPESQKWSRRTGILNRGGRQTLQNYLLRR